jgi:pimeloyl-ACP methyl ester carboxylesterase
VTPVTEFVRTPDACFGDLPGFPFAPRHLEGLAGFGGLRMHYVDEGPRGAAGAFLCLHGEPTWAYLYRRMLPVFLDAGHRVVAPDLFGFGRSDKPVDEDWYTFDRHRQALLAFIEALDLRDITLVCQDWGGLLGLTLPMEMPERFARLLVMNTMLATGDVPLGEGFVAWRAWMRANPDPAVGRLLGRACPHLSPAECAAYDAPFPDPRHKAGVRRFPELVPDRPDAPGAALSRRARDWWRTEWRGQTFLAIGMTDPVLGPPVMEVLGETIRGCPAPLRVAEAGHFTQEWGGRIAASALAHFFPY